MLEAKPVNSTIALHTTTTLSDIEGDRFDDVNLYTSTIKVIVVPLHHWPDITYTVNKVSQCMPKPTILHLQFVYKLCVI